MAEKSAFEKIHVDETEKADLGGVLEQMNLPPAVVTFVRENTRLVQVCIGVIVIAVVAWSLYDSYRDKQVEAGASALSVAVDQEDSQKKVEQLAAVSEEYSGTSSAQWAKVNAAHEMIRTGQQEEALTLYKEVLDETDTSSPLFPLLLIGLAQGYESNENFAEAQAHYEKIKLLEGYQDVGYMGLARISEAQGDNQSALQIYEEYLATLMSVNDQGQKSLVEEKMARLKAML